MASTSTLALWSSTPSRSSALTSFGVAAGVSSGSAARDREVARAPRLCPEDPLVPNQRRRLAGLLRLCRSSAWPSCSCSSHQRPSRSSQP